MTSAEIKAALNVMLAVADAVRDAGRLPLGSLYATLSGHITSMSAFESMIRQLTNTGIIRREGNELVWVG
jgi:hypothetical protein